MLQRRKKPKWNLREEPQIRCPSHLRWVRGFECVLSGKHECGPRIEAHHAREGSNGGMGLKPDDTTAVPLCNVAHAEIHQSGWMSFEKKYGVDLSKIAGELALKSPHRSKWMDRNDHD